MRYGYTTGSCAAAAAKAAALLLLTGENPDSVSIDLPAGGGKAAFTPKFCRLTGPASAEACIVKDAGDDPDVTHGASICATLTRRTEAPASESKIEIDGGKGVGRVTLPGLPVAVGEAAINPVPRKMISREVAGVIEQSGQKGVSIKVEISVPGGEEIAQKTLNPRLGILGGISILGTRGVVVPFSTAAYRSSLQTAVKAAAQNGVSHLLISTGGRTEKFVSSLYPELPPMASIEAGEFIGYALRQCRRYEIKKATLAAMIGKLSKIAKGVLMVHSKKSSVDFEFLAELAKESGADSETAEKVKKANTAAETIDIMKSHPLYFTKITELARHHCAAAAENRVKIEVCLIDAAGTILARTGGAS